MLCVALLVGGVALSYVHEVEAKRSYAAESDRLRVLTNFVAHDLQVNLATLNLVLEGVVRDYLSAPVTSESSHFLTLRLKALEVATPGARSVMVLDATGRVTHSSQGSLVHLDLGHRDYFRQVRQLPDPAMLYMAAPFHTLAPERDLVVAASRMVSDADGKFAGIVTVVLGKEYFSLPFSMGIYAPDVWAVVLHGSGRQIMNFPQDKRFDDASMNTAFFRRHSGDGQAENMLTGQVVAGGPERLVNLRTVKPALLHMNQPIIIGLSRETAAMAQPLRHQAMGLGLFYAALALGCGTGLWWMQSRRIRTEAAAAALQKTRHDADQEKQLLKAARESEQRFRTLIEDAPLAIAILRCGRFIYTNPRYRDLHGYGPEDDLTGMAWSAMVMPAARAGLAAQEALIIADSAMEQKFETQGLGKQGMPVPVSKTTARVELVDGPATLIFAQDISAQKDAENALLLARDVAEAASRAKADFLANMSHEIRSPLNAILGLAYLLEQAPLNTDSHGMVRKLQASGRMLLAIINDVLDVSKIDSGHMDIERVAFRLDDVIDNLAATMGVAVGDKDLQLIIQPMPAGISSLMGDPLRLQQVLSNLAGNAIKFTHAGRVELQVALVSRQGREVVLRFAVIDTGIGIALEQQDEVFSAFTQADSSTTRTFGGTGLGLAICRRLVTLMGGTMGLHSMPGAGSEFWFTLPLQVIAEAELSAPEMARIEALIADDSEIALRVIGDIAASLGWRASTFTSGQALLARLCASPREGSLPNVVILDWKMPGMDGLATARAIRIALPEAECPIVIMATASSQALIGNQPGAELVDAVLNKPVTASALYNAIVEARQRRTVGVDTRLYPAEQGLQGVRLLVVDDSEINRDVAQRILRAQGATVSLAVDGRDALEWLDRHGGQVDLVLMDVQMPVMDGIEATRRLRTQPQFDDLPIVALTAGAFKSQQEVARAAGMTHFISKPFDVPGTIALIQRLRRHASAADVLGEEALAEASHPHAPMAPPGAAAVIDLQRGLQIWTDIRTYRHYLRHFASSYGNAADMIRASLRTHDKAGAMALAHKLAGVAGNIGLPETHRLALEAERVLATEHDPALVLERLAGALAEVGLAIESLVSPPPLPVTMTGDLVVSLASLSGGERAELKPLLLDLLAAIETDNPAPVEPILTVLTARLPLPQVAAIRDAMRMFDFRAAEVAALHLANELDALP